MYDEEYNQDGMIMMMMVVIVMILIMLTNLPHSKESPCMKRTTGMGAVLISPEAGTYTFRYRQSSDWLLGREFLLQCNDHDDGDGDREDVDGKDDDNDVGDDDEDDVGDDDGDDVQLQVVLGLVDLLLGTDF